LDMTVYHGTDLMFSEFRFDVAAPPNGASNGYLGVWLSKTPRLAERFGQYCLTVSAHVGRTYSMPLTELVRLHDEVQSRVRQRSADADLAVIERDFYASVHIKLLGGGFDFIDIVEDSGRVHMCVGLVTANLTILSRTSDHVADPTRSVRSLTAFNI